MRLSVCQAILEWGWDNLWQIFKDFKLLTVDEESPTMQCNVTITLICYLASEKKLSHDKE